MNAFKSILLLTAMMIPVAAHAQPATTPAMPATAAAPAAAAEKPKGPSMTITNAYTFAAAGESGSAAIFLTLIYPTGVDLVPDRLLSASTPAAEHAELHTMLIENNVMTMRPVDSLPLPPTGIFTLKPQGVHIMLTELNQSLKIGDKFPVTLVFEKAGMITTDVVVRQPGDIPVAGPGANAADAPVGEPPEEKAVHQDMMDDHNHHGMNH